MSKVPFKKIKVIVAQLERVTAEYLISEDNIRGPLTTFLNPQVMPRKPGWKFCWINAASDGQNAPSIFLILHAHATHVNVSLLSGSI